MDKRSKIRSVLMGIFVILITSVAVSRPILSEQKIKKSSNIEDRIEYDLSPINLRGTRKMIEVDQEKSSEFIDTFKQSKINYGIPFLNESLNDDGELVSEAILFISPMIVDIIDSSDIVDFSNELKKVSPDSVLKILLVNDDDYSSIYTSKKGSSFDDVALKLWGSHNSDGIIAYNTGFEYHLDDIESADIDYYINKIKNSINKEEV